MQISKNFNLTESHTDLKTIAETYLQQGFPVIPTHANKVAAVKWKDYQTKTATLSDLHQWFVTESRQALGIICGKRSRLIVLDFDTEAQFTRFLREHPELAYTLIIKTRRGWHLWYRIPEDTDVPSRQGKGVDLLADGKYAIAPPSVIKGYTYTVEKLLPMLELAMDDIQRIDTFVTGKGKQPIAATEITETLSPVEITGIYRAHAHVGNRNTALFYAALAARDTGWSCAATIAQLADEYVASGIVGENGRTRYRQAVRTIESAFSRPPRRRWVENTDGLPNAIREKLLELGLDCVVRLIEELWNLGYEGGDELHPEILKDQMQGEIGKHSIYKALKATLPDGTPLFDVVSPRTPSSEASATPLSPDGDQKCVWSESKNRQKPNLGGRPRKNYIFTSIPELFCKLGLLPSRSRDALPKEALRSAKSTRKAMNAALIRRRPGKYSRKILATRLGVCLRTIDTYHSEFEVEYPDFNRAHRFFETPIFWNNLHKIPNDHTHCNGVFLIDDTGKKYPAKVSVATMLLKHNRRVSFMRQTWNEYWFGIPLLPQLPQPETVANQPEHWREAANDYWLSFHQSPASHNRQNLPQNGVFTESATPHKQEGKKTLKKPKSVSKDKKLHNPKRPFSDAEEEALVETLQERINVLCKQPGQGISKRTVRWLIVTYGQATVEKEVRGVERRNYVENPPAFLRDMLKTNARNAEWKRRKREQAQQMDETNSPQPSNNRDATAWSLPEISDSPVESVEQNPQGLGVCCEASPENGCETEHATDTDLWQGTCWKDWFYLIPEVQQQQSFLLDIKDDLLDRNDFEAVRKAVRKYTNAVPKGFD